jgi:hypothetical protein
MPLSSDQLIRELVQEATAESIAEQRRKQRMPFFRPATMMISDQGNSREVSVFTRDICSQGIGLLHDSPLEVESVELGVPDVTSRCDDLRLKIVWSKDVGQGWYISGGQFSKMSVQQSISLLMTAVAKDIAQRLKQRYPYFRPATIALMESGPTDEQAGFVTDISLDGVGLLHEGLLKSGTAIVKIMTRFGNMEDVRVDLKWSRPIGRGWYVAGGPFTRMDFGELPGRLA